MSLTLTSILDRRLACLVALTFGFLVVLPPPQARAALVESRTADGQTISQRATNLETVRTMLEQEVVVQRLADYGYSKQEALARIASASDEQLHQLAALSDSLAAGADGLGLVVTLLVIVLLIVVILKINDREIIIR
jgi:acyl CoA:acetate/3-ketoacid CoA transferase alpha subunit